MYCSSCGTQLGDGRLRCPQCLRFEPDFCLNLFTFLLLITLVVTNAYYFRGIVPNRCTFAAQMKLDLPLVMRLHLGVYNSFVLLGPPLIVLAVAVVLLLRRMKIRALRFLVSGKVLALATWVALAVSLVGIMAGYKSLLWDLAPLMRRG